MSGDISNFHIKRLSETVHLHQIHSIGGQTVGDVPTVIVATWMNAPLQLIIKYAASVSKLFPQSDVLILTQTPVQFFSTDTEPFIPALDLILNASPDKPLVGIAYSNAGARSLTKLAIEYKKRTGKGLPLERLVLDSAPGSPGFEPTYFAFANSLPPSITKAAQPIPWISSNLVWIAIHLMLFTTKTLGYTNSITALRGAINDTELFEVAAGTKRLYIAGEADKIIPYHGVLSSAADAREKGWDVMVEKFSGGHVTHAVAEKERYWKLVERTLKPYSQPLGRLRAKL